MKRFRIKAAFFCLSFIFLAGIGTTTGQADTMDLVSTLVKTLGITEEQAVGGTGALFQNAKDNLSPKDFKKVSETVPNMGAYLEAAPKVEQKKGIEGSLGGALSSLGGGASKAGGLLGLTDAFSKLGMDSGTLTKFIPVVLDFVQSKGGESVAGLLKTLWQ